MGEGRSPSAKGKCLGPDGNSRNINRRKEGRKMKRIPTGRYVIVACWVLCPGREGVHRAGCERLTRWGTGLTVLPVVQE